MLNINLEKMIIPELTDTKAYNGNYYVPGIDGKWFLNLLEYYNNSSIHSAIIQNLHRRLQKDFEDDPIYYKISLDYLVFGGYSLEVLWNFNHDKIVHLNHLDFSKVRCGLEDEYGNISLFYYSNDFFKYNNRKLQVLAPYNEEKISDDHQCFYFRRYSAGSEIYPKPYYYSCLRWVITDIEIARYYSSLVKNNFVSNMIITIPQFYDEEKSKALEKTLKNNFTGGENAANAMVFYTESKEGAPILTKFNNDEDDKKYRYLLAKNTENIAMGHNLPASLLGLMVPGQLGNATDLPVYEEIYNKFVVTPLKNDLVNSYSKLKNKLVPNV